MQERDTSIRFGVSERDKRPTVGRRALVAAATEGGLLHRLYVVASQRM